MKSVFRLLLFAFICAGLISSSFRQNENAAMIKFSIGKAELLRANQTDWQKVRVNMPVHKGDRLRTALQARMELEMPDGSVIKIRENTVFDVKEIKTPDADNEDEMSFTIWAGNIWAKFKKVVSSRQDRRIESPSAVVAIRGTTLEINVDQNQTTRVSVTEGQVAVTSKEAAGEVLVGSNQETLVEKGKAPTKPSAFTPVEEEDQTTDEMQAGLFLNINAERLQYNDPVVLSAGIPVSGRATPGALVTANGQPLSVKPDGNFAGKVSGREGLNVINFRAQKSGESVDKDLKVFINTKSPQIHLSRPLTSRFMNRRDYSLSGAVFDPTPMDKVKVFINDDMVAEIDGKGSFNRTIILNEGKNNVRIAATDRSNNTTEITEQMFLDTIKPIITITEPTSNVQVDIRPPLGPPDTNAREFERVVRGVIIDPEPSSGLKQVTINGKEVKPRSDGSFEVYIPVKRGITAPIIVTAEDLAGNISRNNSHSIRIP
ncbi:MAG: FecR domain-containing protein [Calditrichaceae bacterium]|nr:FecR domain-containing protein [Calditrichaceae bacterium]